MRILAVTTFLAATAAPAAPAFSPATAPAVTVSVEPGVHLRVIDAGPTNAPAILFIPGWGMEALPRQ